MIDINNLDEHNVTYILALSRKKNIWKNHVHIVRLNFNRIKYLRIRISVIWNLQYVSFVRINMRLRKYLGMRKCVELGLNIVLFVRSWWCSRILHSMKEDVSERKSKEDNNAKFHKIIMLIVDNSINKMHNDIARSV